MGKYRKKPVVIEAEQWLPCGGNDWNRMAARASMEMPYPPAPHRVLRRRWWRGWQIKGPDGWVNLAPFDWVICGVRDDWYPCKPDIFKATYDLVEEK